jgi:hypothetical protein
MGANMWWRWSKVGRFVPTPRKRGGYVNEGVLVHKSF